MGRIETEVLDMAGMQRDSLLRIERMKISYLNSESLFVGMERRSGCHFFLFIWII